MKKPWWLLFAGLLSVTAKAQLTLEVAANGLNPAQQAASAALVAKAQARLPTRFVQRLDQQVTIHWRVLAPEVMGRLRSRHDIELNLTKLDAWLANPQQRLTGRTHASLEQELIATLVHELAHLYDRNVPLPLAVRRCQREAKQIGVVGLRQDCLGQAERRFTLSDEPRFLDLAGWPRRMGARGARVGENFYQARSPDEYELKNAREFFAVNFEYFLLDPEYGCRRPALFAYFNAHFNLSNTPECATLYYLNASLEAGDQALGEIDPARVYEVDYLFAEANQNWASRFGHSMLRLVICAPERAPGPDCRLDLSHHLVLSYRAFVDDLQLSSWQGLTGGYPSRLFILPLAQVIDEYTKVELRALSSVPLKLTRETREALVKQALQTHWSYDGQYYFLSNNCAVETLNLLRAGADLPALSSLETLTPTGLLNLLRIRGVAANEVLDDLEQAQRLGYWFDSYRERYKLMLTVLNERLQLPEMSVEAWLAESPHARRRWFQGADTQSLAALLLLEQAAFRQSLMEAQHTFKQRYFRQSQAAQTMAELIASSHFLSRPADLLSEGYGIAQPAEVLAREQAINAQYQRLLGLNQTLKTELEPLLGAAHLAKLEALEANLAQLRQALRASIKSPLRTAL